MSVGLAVTPNARATVTGQWDFNSSNLTATVGTDLAYRGDTETYTVFTTATIGGETANVMGFPATTPSEGYIMTHGIPPSGGGSLVDQYSLVMDILVPSASSGKYRCLLQTDTNNLSDGNFWINPANALGTAGQYSGNLTLDQWHRIVWVYDGSATATRMGYRIYVDGAYIGSAFSGSLSLHGLLPQALLFADNDGETFAGYVSSIQIHDRVLCDSYIAALGGPTAAGIPTNVFMALDVTVTPANRTDVLGMTVVGPHFSASVCRTAPPLYYQWYLNNVAVQGQTNSQLQLSAVHWSDAGSYTVVVSDGVQSVTSSPPVVLTVNPPSDFVTGQWDFNHGDLRASFGQPLQYFDAQAQSDTSFGTTTSFGISDIAGQPANVMYYAPTTGGPTGFIMSHGIAPNGGGTNVNQYTVILDLLYPASSDGYWRSLWQTDPSNLSDGDLFVRETDSLGILSQYDGLVTADTWHRVVFTFDLTSQELGKYIDGTNVVTGPYSGIHQAQYLPAPDGQVDNRWSLQPTALLLGDNDGEVLPMYLSSVQIRNGRMTDAEVAAMGGPTAYKAPG